MDNYGEQRSWATPGLLIVTCWVLVGGAVGWAVFATDPRGRLLIGIAAVALAAYACFAMITRPRLAADREGVRVRRLTGTRAWRWPELHVKVVRTRRLGRDVSTLELEAHEHGELIILGWLDLGADPNDVLETLDELRGS